VILPVVAVLLENVFGAEKGKLGVALIYHGNPGHKQHFYYRVILAITDRTLFIIRHYDRPKEASWRVQITGADFIESRWANLIAAAAPFMPIPLKRVGHKQRCMRPEMCFRDACGQDGAI